MRRTSSRGTYLDVDAGRIPFRAYAEGWLASRTFSPLTYEATELRLRLHVFPTLGHLELRQIKPSTIQKLLRSMEMAETYRRVIFSNVSAIFSAAVDDDMIAKNPCKASSVTRPATSRRKVVPWPSEWVSSMHDALPPQYRIAVTLGSGLGLRQGEVFGLAVEDIDFLRGVVEVRRQVKVFGGNRLVFGLPKGDKTRTVPLPESVATELSGHLATYPRRSVTLPWGTPQADKKSAQDSSSPHESALPSTATTSTHGFGSPAKLMWASSNRVTTACTPYAIGTPPCSWTPANRFVLCPSTSATATPASPCAPIPISCPAARSGPGQQWMRPSLPGATWEKGSTENFGATLSRLAGTSPNNGWSWSRRPTVRHRCSRPTVRQR